MFDLDEGFHAMQNLDSEGRKALKLAGKVWEEVYGDVRDHAPAPLTRRYLSELSERTEQVRVLRDGLNDVLDSREAAELRAEAAELLLEKVRAWATSWSLSTELDMELARWRSHCRREPRSPHRERPDKRDAELLLLRRHLGAAREAESVAIGEVQAMRNRMTKAVEAEHRVFRIAEHERDRAVAAEQKTDELRNEVSRLRSHLDF